MTIIMRASFNGLEQGSVQTLAATEEARLIGLGLAQTHAPASRQLVEFDAGTGQITSPSAQEAVMGASVSLTSGQWYSVPAFCQITLAGTGSYSYSARNAAGTVTAGGSGTCPDTVPVYMGSDTQISVTFPATATAKVN